VEARKIVETCTDLYDGRAKAFMEPEKAKMNGCWYGDRDTLLYNADQIASE